MDDSHGLMTLEAPPEVLTVDEVAALLRLSVKTVKRLPLRKVRLGHHTVRYLRKDVLAFMDGRAA